MTRLEKLQAKYEATEAILDSIVMIRASDVRKEDQLDLVHSTIRIVLHGLDQACSELEQEAQREAAEDCFCDHQDTCGNCEERHHE